MQHLDFPHRRMADVDPERVVPTRRAGRPHAGPSRAEPFRTRSVRHRPRGTTLRRACPPRAAPARIRLEGAPFRGEAEIEHVPLDGGEPMRPVGPHEALLPVVAGHLHERVEGVAAAPPPCGEELVALGEVPFGGVRTLRPPADLAPGVDVSPVLPARVEHEETKVDPPADCAQHVEIGRGEGGHREEARPAGPLGGPGAALDRVAEGIDRPHPVSVGALRLHHPPPEPRLPVRSVAAAPFADPLRAVHHAAIEHPGESVRELEALARVAVREIAPDRPPLPVLHRESRQDLVDAPAKLGRRERLLHRQPGDGAPHDGPGEAGGQLELEVGGDPERPGKLQREPAPDGPVRHHDAFGGKRIPRLGAHELRERRGERFQPIGVDDPQAPAQPSSFATPFGTCPMAATPRAASQWRR